MYILEPYEKEILAHILNEPDKCKAIPTELYNKFMEYLIESEDYRAAGALKLMEDKCVDKTLDEILRDDSELIFSSDWTQEEILIKLEEVYKKEEHFSDSELMDRFGILFVSVGCEEQIKAIKKMNQIFEERDDRRSI